MFGWVKKRAIEAFTDAMRNDIERFTAGLKGAGDKELSTMLVIANIMRLRLIESGTIPPAALDLNILRDDALAHQCDMSSVALVSLIKEFQKMGQPSDATGAMIWLHSVRALNVPEIRILGREMWKQLERGFPYVEDALLDMQELIGEQVPHIIGAELTFIPRGLEPRT